MTTNEIINIVAIIIGPILAVQAQKFLERRREDINKKLQIFKTLMATRGSTLSILHVEALNRIDLEFSGNKKYTIVILRWKEYFDNLSQKVNKDSEAEFVAWNTKNEELLANLLFEMGQSLGYNFDKVLIKRNIYSPIGHAIVEHENNEIRKNILSIVKGETSLPIEFITSETTEEASKKQMELQEVLIKHYKNKEPINVILLKESS